MGIKNLSKFLDKFASTCRESKKYEDYTGKAIAIDTSLVIYKYISAMRKTGKDLTNKDGNVTSHLHGMLFLINKLLSLKITPIFVFDGKPPDIKKGTLKKRQDIKKNANDKISQDVLNELTMKEKITLFMQSTKISPEIIQDAKLFLKTLGIPFIDSVEEADAQMVCLVQNNLAHAVATEDMDLLTFGASRVLKNFFSLRENNIIEIDREKMLKQLKFTSDQFIDTSILLGCDYLPTISKVGMVKTFEYVTKHKSLENIFKIVEQPENYDYEEVRSYFKNAISKCTIPTEESMKVVKTDNTALYKLLVDKYEFNLPKYNSFILSRNKFFI
jgi:flap endonuclease-1